MTRKYLFILFFLLLSAKYSLAQEHYSSTSRLSNGQWYKIAIVEEGIYKIGYSDLVYLGLDDPSRPQIFGNNNGQLSYINDNSAKDDLSEIPIYIEKGADGIFGEGDYILFYGQSTNRWIFDYNNNRYEYLKHDYSDTAFYFLTSSTNVVTMKTMQNINGTSNYQSDKSDFLYRHEVDNENLLKSGREWFEPINPSSSSTININIPNITNDSVSYKIRVVGRSSYTATFSLLENNSLVKSINTNGVEMSTMTGTYAQISESSGSIFSTRPSVSFSLLFDQNGVSNAKGWLDYLEIKARVNNIYQGEQTIISDLNSIGEGFITTYSLQSESSPIVWDISDPYDPTIVQYQKSGSTISFSSRSDSLKRFIAFETSNCMTPIYIHRTKNQDLHASDAVDMIIVTHPLFKDYAYSLADLHLTNDGISSYVVTPEEIYNEFSGGIKDIVAIRNFIRMKYQRQNGTATPLRYLLLFGDGTYQNKENPPNNPNYIPTYQSKNSNVISMSYTSDDFFSLLDYGEGEAIGTEDIGVGRLPVSDTTEAGILIRKIAKYVKEDNYGDWRNVVCIVADDEDNNTHLNDAEDIANHIIDTRSAVEVKKLYLDAYRQNSSATGETYPDVEKAINDQMNAGCLVFNYVGHGNENGLAAERVVKNEDIDSWTNGNRLPLFITATCEFSRFDDAIYSSVTDSWFEKKSSGERVLLNDKGGSIALMSTSRVSYSAFNHTLNDNIIEYLFAKDSLNRPLRLGDIIRLAKNHSGNDINKRNFTLLGDPAIALSIPSDGYIRTDSIIEIVTQQTTDTIKALSKIRINGHVEDNSGALYNNFNGSIYITIYDKPSAQTTNANDGGEKTTFYKTDNILFSGSCDVQEGLFRFDAIIPRDINYSYGNGFIRYYAYGEGLNFKGAKDDVVIGGYSENAETDTIGPKICVYINDVLFKNGGITDLKPNLFVTLSDESGINTSGQSIGHDITAIIDDDINGYIILNDYFINEKEDPTSGTITYPLGEIEPGRHRVTIKAWDNHNNSSQASVEFIAKEDKGFILSNPINYPNPMSNSTMFTVGHNRPGEEMKITISIFDISGKLIKRINSSVFSDGYQIPQINWDGIDSQGGMVGDGIYIYRFDVETSKGEKGQSVSKLMILRH